MEFIEKILFHYKVVPQLGICFKNLKDCSYIPHQPWYILQFLTSKCSLCKIILSTMGGYVLRGVCCLLTGGGRAGSTPD